MVRLKNGFSLIELIVVILIIAILAPFAVSRYIDQTATARQNSIASLAVALSAASANNYAMRSANSSLGSAITNCNQIGALLPSSLPSGYTITSQAISADASVTCVLTGPSNTIANFVGLGVS